MKLPMIHASSVVVRDKPRGVRQVTTDNRGNRLRIAHQRRAKVKLQKAMQQEVAILLKKSTIETELNSKLLT